MDEIKPMHVLVACEESQEVCKAFRTLGHEAYSCDIEPCSGGHDEWHIQGNVLNVLNAGNFITADGTKHYVETWDLMVAHPPCTYLSNVATRSFSLKCSPAEKVCERWKLRGEAAIFFMQLMLAPIERIAVENPVGFMNTAFRKPDQIIHPYMFSESESDKENYVTKRTCLWLKNLPKLEPTYYGPKPDNATMYGVTPSGKVRVWEDSISRSSKVRSKTFPGIAQAMAEQWGGCSVGLQGAQIAMEALEAINNAAVAYIEGGPYENDLPGLKLAMEIDRLSQDFMRPPEELEGLKKLEE